jgi:glucose/arabinose dehydrogenase
MRSCALVVAALSGAAAAEVVAPPGFTVETVASGFTRPVGIAFTSDGSRMFVAEQEGLVRVVEDGVTLAEPFIDLRAEVNGEWDRGLLGIALDPDFLANRHVYLLYTVDPVPGERDESPFLGAFGRLTRYTGTVASNGNVASPSSRLVLLGDTPARGIPVCDPSHTVGSVRFALDGTLFVSAGDGAHFNEMDDGGLDRDCFAPGMFPESEDIGAFRAQWLDSLAGKILRVNPATGHGLPGNPHYTGNPDDNRSRIWASGVRNPYRITVRPGSPPPGTVIIGDVGWFLYEEINVCRGGENFGWPCVEGPSPAPSYPINGDPDHGGCETIETPGNPGPLTAPLAWWHHVNPALSAPSGFTGAAALGGEFYTGGCYPEPWPGALFVADHIAGFIKAIELDADNRIVGFHHFASSVPNPVDLVAHPLTGDLHYVALFAGQVRRISYSSFVTGDVTGDCIVGIADLLLVLGSWGSCGGCAADVDDDGTVGILDLLIVLGAWS